MDNFNRPAGGDPGDHQPTEQFWPGHPATSGSGQSTPRQQPDLRAHLTKDRRKALYWTIGIALAVLLAGGGVIAGASLAGMSLSATPTASTATGGTGSGGTGSTVSASTSGTQGGTGQAALLNAALNAGSPNAAVSGNPAAPPNPAGTAAPADGPCARAVRAARQARLTNHPRVARRTAGAAIARCRLVRRRIIRFFLLRGVEGQFSFRTPAGTIRTLAYERGVIESVNTSSSSTGSSIVVKSADGTTWTWDLVASTVVREQGGKVSESALGVGEPVWVGGPVVGGAKDARLIFVRPPGG